jgi:uncharacterized membrane protein YkoI
MGDTEFRFALPATALAITVAGWSAAASGYGVQEVASAVTARTSAAEAVAAAERQTRGHAFEVGYEQHGFHVQVITGDGKLSDIAVDPISGKVQHIDPEGLVSRLFDADDHSEAGKLSLAKLSLPQAITATERQTSRKAIAARFETNHGKIRYEVRVANGTKEHQITIDAATGKLLAADNAQSDEHDCGE